MSYAVKEIFLTLQGEGAHAGRASVFCRFAGCNHVKEKGCAVLQAVKDGKIPVSRHRSYVRLYEELKDLKEWQK